jgi:hypothetical protein
MYCHHSNFLFKLKDGNSIKLAFGLLSEFLSSLDYHASLGIEIKYSTPLYRFIDLIYHETNGKNKKITCPDHDNFLLL